MFQIGSISFLEPRRSSKRCVPSHKSNLWNILDTNESVLWNVLDTLPPFDFRRRSNVHSILGTSCSLLIWLFTFTAAIAAASRRGQNSFAFTSSWFSLVFSVIFWSHHNSNGYKCWTARSRYDLPARSVTALVIPSRPDKSWWTIPVFHCALFFLSSRMITTYPFFNFSSLEFCMWLCCSLKPLRYSFVQRDHTRYLQERMYLPRFFRSQSSVLFASNFSSKFGCPRIIKFGLWMPSSIHPSGRSLSVISISKRTLSSSFHDSFVLPLALNKACLVNPIIFST